MNYINACHGRWTSLAVICWLLAGAIAEESACQLSADLILLQVRSAKKATVVEDGEDSGRETGRDDHHRSLARIPLPTSVVSAASTPILVAKAIANAGELSDLIARSKNIDRAWLEKVLAFGLLVGGVFGMMGAGGSMILKPVLYYGFGVQPFSSAIFNGYVILIVLAAAAALKGHRRGLVCWRMVGILLLATGFGSMLGSFQASRVSNRVQIWAFANVLLVVAAHMAIKSTRGAAGSGGADSGPSAGGVEKPIQESETNVQTFNLSPKAVLLGMSAGLLSGFMGMGGGFILVPVVRELGLDMAEAVPTAQAVVSLSASLGFCNYILFMGCTVHMLDAPVTASLISTGLLGIAISGAIASRLPDMIRQLTFAGMLAAIAIGMMVARP